MGFHARVKQGRRQFRASSFSRPLGRAGINCPAAVLLCVATAAAAVSVPAPPAFKSGGYILIDHTTGAVLAEENADAPLPPASLTKIMTAYIAFGEIKAGRLSERERTTVSKKARFADDGSRTFLEAGSRVAIGDILRGVVVQSGNDASIALAEHIAGSEQSFVAMMNAQAARLGMDGTRFVNSTGLPTAGHVSTARDMAVLTRAMVTEFPRLYKLLAIESCVNNNIKKFNRNKLLWRDGAVDGVKTGYTKAAGYCLAASAARDGMRLISVILGAPSDNTRNVASLKLLEHGFRYYETRPVYGGGEELTTNRVWKGEKKQVSLGAADEVVVTIPRGGYPSLSAEVEYNGDIIAPVRRGDAVGKLAIFLADETVAELPLVALEDVATGGVFTRWVDAIRLLGR